jgi:hypothetical protein
MSFASILLPFGSRIPVPGTCWAEPGSRIPVPGTCWGRRAMSFASILLPFGSRIPVPGTCWAEPGFASNAGRPVPDSGARHLLGPLAR